MDGRMSGRRMGGRMSRKWGALVGALGLTLTTGVIAMPTANTVKVAAAAPTDPTDESKVPHYFGPYPNWANSPQVLANAVVEISLGTPTPVAVGNPLIARAYATDFAIAPGQLGPVFVVLPSAALPAGTLQSFQTWNQVEPGGSPTSSAGNLFHAYVLRPTGTANQYTVVYDSGELTVPALADPLVSAVATFPVQNVPVLAGDVLGFYGQGIPVDTGVAVPNPDILSYPAPASPAESATLTLGDSAFPLFSQDRSYSFSATVTPTITDPGTGAEATATVDPKTGGISAVTVTSPGAGYVLPPTVSITAAATTPTAPANATAVIADGVVTSIAVNETGFGFTAPAVTITGGNPTTGFDATAVASGGVDDLALTNGGSGYLVQPIVEFSLPQLAAGVVPTATATMDASGVVTTVNVVTPGSGYTSAPTVTILDGNAPATNPATAATATATIGIGQIDITSGGQGYDSAPAVAINDTVGVADKGASATATVAVKGSVTAINVTAPGAGYLTPGIQKFVDTLAGLGPTAANNLGNYIPVAVPDTTTYPGADYYEIALVQYRQRFHSDLPETLLRGYVQISTSVVPGLQVPLTNANLDPLLPASPALLPDGSQAVGVDNPRYLGPTIVASKDKPVRVLFRNLLPTGDAGDLFLPVDTTLMGSGMGPDAIMLGDGIPIADGGRGPLGVPMDMVEDQGSVLDGVRNPACGETPKPSTCYSENRATLHLHGGVTPWISDGTPHQWITPAGETTNYPEGVSVSNVPDMPAPELGSQTFFYSNQQSARLMFYHDHSWGITRLNVYAGEAAGYLVTDEMEKTLIAPTGALAGLGVGTPLIIQDKTFVPSPDVLAQADPTWDAARWGGEGSLWTPHVYMPAQNPGDPSGMSAFGRWMYGPWFWPPAKDVKNPPIANPYYLPVGTGPGFCDPSEVLPDGSLKFCEPALIPSTPNISVGMEAFNDTPMVNGTVYPTTTVDPKAYRYRVLNAANDRFWNLSWYVADPRTGTLSEVALNPAELEAAQTDPVVSPTPDTNWSPKGPSWIQIGSEGGFLPAPVVVPAQPTTWITDPTRFDVGNVDQHSLLLAPAERADAIVDFSQYRGKTLILYNDAPAAFPARVPGYDYYTGGPDMSPAGAPTTLPGYGPNTRTIMQVKVSSAAPAVAFDRPNTTFDRMGALETAFAHKADGSGVFESSMDPIIVGQAAYNSAYGSNFVASGWCNSPTNPTAKCDGYARIMEQGAVLGDPDPFKFKFDTLGTDPSNPSVPKPQLAIPLQPKGMHDEMNSANFDEWGRMTANLGLEAPGATPLLQNIILYPYVNPATEILNSTGMPSALDVTPISSAADGTQIWKITHNGVDTHPIHFHLYDVQVLNRVTWDNIIIPPEPTELGWKETVRISPLEDTIVALRPIVPVLPFAVPDSSRPLNPMMPIGAKGDVNGVNGLEAGFNNTNTLGNPIAPISNDVTDFDWEYVFHCHILSHEEMDMMRPVTVQAPWTTPLAPTGLTFTRGSVILNWVDNTPVDYKDPVSWGNPAGGGGTNPAQEIGFDVWRAPVSGPGAGDFVDIADVPANRTTYTDTTSTWVPTMTYDYKVTARNEAGSSPASNVATATGVGESTTVLVSSPSPSTVGEKVTFTATVASTTTGTPSGGTVEFFDGVTSLGSSPLVDGATATASLSTAGLSLGEHTITAVYGGDTVFTPSTSGDLIHLVNQGATSTAVSSNLNPSISGAPVTFTATVSPTVGAVVPTGTVEFFIDGASLGSGTLVDGSVSSVSVADLALGSHTITAVYSGDANFTGSTSGDLIQVVSPNNTTTLVTSDVNPSVYGDQITFTATVSAILGSPTGTVEFFDGTSSLAGPLTVVGGSAGFNIATLGGGSHAITAVYIGDANFIASTSDVLTQVVNPATSSTAVASSRNPSDYGETVTFTATVSAPFGSPTGAVEFFDGATSLGSGALVGGSVSSAPVADLAAGSRTITAVYSGDVNFTGSTNAVTQVVTQGTTSATVASSPNPSIGGDSVTFTANVSVLTGIGNPTGTVQFFDGATSLGSSPLGAGTASVSIASLGYGSHTITAVYSGDANFTGSTSPSLAHVVLRATTTVVTSSRNPSTFGQTVTFTVRIRPVVGTVLVPTGTVQFSIDGVPVAGTSTLNIQGRATYSTTLPTGSRSVTAAYIGDGAVFAGSGSVPLAQVVNKAASSTSLTSPNTWFRNQPMQFTATVTPLAATGTVQFTRDGAEIGGPVTLDANGQATITTTFSTIGNHTITAVYSGDGNFLTSTRSRTQRVR